MAKFFRLEDSCFTNFKVLFWTTKNALWCFTSWLKRGIRNLFALLYIGLTDAFCNFFLKLICQEYKQIEFSGLIKLREGVKPEDFSQNGMHIYNLTVQANNLYTSLLTRTPRFFFKKVKYTFVLVPQTQTSKSELVNVKNHGKMKKVEEQLSSSTEINRLSFLMLTPWPADFVDKCQAVERMRELTASVCTQCHSGCTQPFHERT